MHPKPDLRRRVHRMVGGWRQRFGGPPRARRRETDLAVLGDVTKRFCANGDAVGELIARSAPAKGAELNGFNTATAAGKGTRRTAPKSQAGSLMITRMKRGRSVDRRSLNGFSMQRAGSAQSTGQVSVDHSPRRSNKPRNLRPLNGFIMQGTTDFRFSVAPER